MVAELQLLQSGAQCSVDFCLWGWVKNEIYRRKFNTRGELLARILDAAANKVKHKDQLRETTRGRTPLSKCTGLRCGFLNMYCEMYLHALCHFCMTNLSLIH
jgi:hypothetical protein